MYTKTKIAAIFYTLFYAFVVAIGGGAIFFGVIVFKGAENFDIPGIVGNIFSQFAGIFGVVLAAIFFIIGAVLALFGIIFLAWSAATIKKGKFTPEQYRKKTFSTVLYVIFNYIVCAVFAAIAYNSIKEGAETQQIIILVAIPAVDFILNLLIVLDLVKNGKDIKALKEAK
ncbi:MAG: hypothetical protein LBT30_05790 [Clostridiales bacterium]|jgi:hypothetical protein|nr:hypothetical protein [Clostridiales bacterium]